MATKTLSISEEAYNNLIKLKKEGESFSQLILRMTSMKGNPNHILQTLQIISSDNPENVEDLANNIELVFSNRKNRKMRDVDL